MEKTNPEPLQEAKPTAVAGSEEKQNASVELKTNPVKRTIAVIVAVLSILSLEIPWLLNKPSILKLSLLLAGAILVGLLFGLGLTAPVKQEKDDKNEKSDGVSGWSFAGLYLIVSVVAALIYCFCPNLRINGWLYILINLVEALVASFLGWFFCFITLSGTRKAINALVLILAVVVAVSAVYFGWPCFQNNSSPVLALLLPGIVLAETAISGLLIYLFIAFISMTKASSVREKIAYVIAILLTIAVAGGVLFFGWSCRQNNSLPVLALLLPGIALGGSALAGGIGFLLSLPAAIRNAVLSGFREGMK